MEMNSLDSQMRRETCHIPCNKLVSTCRRLTVFAAIPLLPQRGSGGATSLFSHMQLSGRFLTPNPHLLLAPTQARSTATGQPAF